MKNSNLYSFVFIAILYSCSSNIVIYTDKTSLPLRNTINHSPSIDSIISPYRDSMQKEMNEILASSDYDFIAKRPSSNLMNWVADALYSNILKKEKLDAPAFCLLNYGSLRSTINKGKVTRGDLFTLMPFDNEVVIVKMNKSTIPEIENYILKTGGEPISGAIINNKKLQITNFKEKTQDNFYIITSDYLLNGGDRMNFFTKQIKVIYPKILLRDVLIEEAKIQGNLLLQDDLRLK